MPSAPPGRSALGRNGFILAGLLLLVIVPTIAAEEHHVSGPLTASTAGVAGGATLNGLFDAARDRRLHDDLVRAHRPSYFYAGRVKPGVAAPRQLRFYDMPLAFGGRGYRYTLIDGKIIVVEPSTHVVVRVID